MKVHCGEGSAIHTGPESCVDDPRGARRSVDRGAHRPAIELRKSDAVETAEGNTEGGVTASRPTTPRGLRPRHVRTLLAREPGDLVADHGHPPVARIGKAWSHSR